MCKNFIFLFLTKVCNFDYLSSYYIDFIYFYYIDYINLTPRNKLRVWKNKRVDLLRDTGMYTLIQKYLLYLREYKTSYEVNI